MSERLPFTKKQRRRLCYQDGYGHRATNDWGSGDLPAPFAEGDIVQLNDTTRLDDRCEGEVGDFFVVGSGFSIGEGDDWYFRVVNSEGKSSDRLHVIAGDVDYMRAFVLVDTADPEGLDRRARLLAEGWEPPMSDPGTYEAAVMAAMCGAPWSVDVNNEHWFIVCTQSPDHPGPHVGMISWPKTEGKPVNTHATIGVHDGDVSNMG